MTHVEVWCAAVPAAFDPALEARYVALLNPGELQQRDRFRFDVLKRRYLLTRTLVRTVLSRHAPLAPEDWVFENNAHGRPRIALQGCLSVVTRAKLIEKCLTIVTRPN